MDFKGEIIPHKSSLRHLQSNCRLIESVVDWSKRANQPISQHCQHCHYYGFVGLEMCQIIENISIWKSIWKYLFTGLLQKVPNRPIMRYYSDNRYWGILVSSQQPTGTEVLLRSQFLRPFSISPFSILISILPLFFSRYSRCFFFDVPVFSISQFSMSPYSILPAPFEILIHKLIGQKTAPNAIQKEGYFKNSGHIQKNLYTSLQNVSSLPYHMFTIC